MEIVVAVAPGEMENGPRLLAQVSLHALARRVRRRLDGADTAVLAGPAGLAECRPGEERVRVAKDEWCAGFTDVVEAGKTVPALAARTFLPAGR